MIFGMTTSVAGARDCNPCALRVPSRRGLASDLRYDADFMGGQEVVEREAEPGHTRCHCSRQKKGGPAVESLPGEQPEENYES